MQRVQAVRGNWAGAIAVLALWGLAGCGTVYTPQPTVTPTLAPMAARGTLAVAPGDFYTPIPPTPTFTPVPSPTPVVYVVQSGDTLLGIALQYGVSVDALRDANGLENPQFLSIGQALIIPVGHEEVQVTLGAPGENLILPTPTPLPLSLAGVTFYHTPVGGLWCLGEVVNDSQGPVTNLQIQVVLVDAAGNPLDVGMTLAAADYLPGGARAPFALLFKSPPANVATVRATLVRAEPIGEITAAFVPLAVAGGAGAVSGPQYRVSGQVVNDSGVAVERVTVVVTIYDARQRVLGYRQAQLMAEGVLEAGTTLPFAVLLTPQGLESPANFSILAWGSRIP